MGFVLTGASLSLLLIIALVVSFIIEYLVKEDDASAQALVKIPGMKSTSKETGNLTDITKAGSLHEFLVQLHAKYGDVATFWFGKTHYVSVASPEAWKDTVKLFDRPVGLFEFIKPLFGEKSIQFANGDDGKQRRKLHDVSFTHQAVKRYYPVFHEKTDILIRKIMALSSEEHIPLSEYVSIFVMKSLMSSLFGQCHEDDEQAITMIRHYETVMLVLNKKISADTEKKDTFQKALNAWYEFIGEIIHQRRTNPPDESRRTFIDDLADNAEDDKTLECDIITYVVAAYQTSTFMLVWCVYHMASQSDVQEKVYNEVINVLGNKSNVDHNSHSQLKYTMQVLMETLRWSTLGPFAARVNMEEDITVQGYTIPKNTPILQALGVVHVDEEIWPEPDRFDPDRFSPRKIKKRHGMSFQPLGFAGQRICPGHRFAYAEGVVFLASLCRQFRFHVVEGQNIQRKFGFVTIPDSEIWVTATKRD